MPVFYPQVSVLSAADVDFGINSFIASVLKVHNSPPRAVGLTVGCPCFETGGQI